jgi:hypothetical protein
VKITVIHNTYRRNPFVRESVAANLKALKDSNIEHQYIVFNDNGDKEIEQDISGLDVEYFYSEKNYGKKMCSGGWIGALPLVKGDLIHNTGQDLFYERSLRSILYKNIDLVYSNGFSVREDLSPTGNVLGPLQQSWNYENPRGVLSGWLGIENGKITRSNNYIPAPGVIYKKSLHEEIGPPDIEEFRGIADFEYWTRILFYKKKIEYLYFPTWLYRLSKYTTTNEVIDGKLNERDLSAGYHEKLKQKYQNLLDNE